MAYRQLSVRGADEGVIKRTNCGIHRTGRSSAKAIEPLRLFDNKTSL
jgi:hypothetical protein